ncbi:MAG: BLUF domain-containing protein [Pseudomonadota bacterium]
MGKLVQIIYISRSTSAPGRPENGLDPVVARILAKSRSNNRKNGLVGVLYFGDGCFFQCLEGEEGTIDTLYAKLEQDPRHKDLKIISRKSIAAPSFKDWSMKYVPVEQAMIRLMQSKGITGFDPYRFDDDTTHGVIELLHRATEPPELAAPVAEVSPTPPAAPLPEKKSAGTMAMALGAVAALAAGGLLYAFL